jgi:hypothetical protein
MREIVDKHVGRSSMRTPLLSALLAGLGIAAGVALDRAPAAGRPGGAELRRLIEQLGSPSFSEREEATAALDAAGEPALPGLRSAATSDDAEVRRRAADLVRKIEMRLETDHLLAPTTVNLDFNNTMLRQAVVELSKQSQWPISLSDPKSDLRDRKVTLSTGPTTFWEALDRLCSAAHLAEEGQAPAADAALLATAPGFPPGAVAPPAVVAARMRMLGNRVVPVFGAISLVRKDRAEQPTSYAGAVRIRGQHLSNDGDATHILLDILVAAEPKVRFNEHFTLRVDKVLDDQGQELSPSEDVAPPPVLPQWRTATPPSTGFTLQHLQTRLGAGEKPARSLREVRGTLTGRLYTEQRPVLWTGDVLTSAGKTFAGKEGGSIRVIDAAKDGPRHVTMHVEIEFPPDVTTQDAPGVPLRMRPLRGGAAPAGGGGMPIMAGPAPAVSGGRRVGGLCLLDDKGNAVPPAGLQLTIRRGGAGGVREYTLDFNVAEGRMPTALVLEGSKVVDVELPFTLKDIRLQ